MLPIVQNQGLQQQVALLLTHAHRRCMILAGKRYAGADAPAIGVGQRHCKPLLERRKAEVQLRRTPYTRSSQNTPCSQLPEQGANV